MLWTRRIASLAFLCILISITGTVEAQLFASEPDGAENLLTLNLITGAATIIGPITGAEGPISELEWSPDGFTLYATTGDDTSMIHTINPATGFVLNTVPQDLLGELTGLDFSAAGTLFATFIPIATVNDTEPSFLVTVDPNTGAMATRGEIGSMRMVGLAFAPSSTTLYVIDEGTEEGADPKTDPFIPPVLYSIDRPSGQIILMRSTTLPNLASSLEFDSDGRLLVGCADDNLYSINPSTGLATLVGRIFTSTGVISGLSTRPGGELLVTPASQIVSRFLGTTFFSVSNVGVGPMPWTAAVISDSPWLRIASGSPGLNAGTIVVEHRENANQTLRAGTIEVSAPNAGGSPMLVTVTQAKAVFVLGVTPADQTVGFRSGTTGFKVSNLDSGEMPWSARLISGNSWLNIISGFSGVSSGAVQVAFTENPGPGSRVATIEVTAANTIGSPLSLKLTQRPSVLIDLTMSLYEKPLDPAYPRGDDLGNVQNPTLPSEQDRYELLLQHFVDAVYEATDGRHLIRSIRIFRQGGRPQDTDINWREAGHPNTRVVAGAGLDGGSLNMYDVFTGGAVGGGNLPFLQSATGLQKGGHVLAQRWMHYFLGVEHEFTEISGDVPAIGTLMADPYKASDNTSPAFLNLSAAPNRPNPISGGVLVFDTSRANEQLRLYRLSAWETISQIYNDPKTANELAIASREFYSELADIAPTGLDMPEQFNLSVLPGSITNSRSDLNIIWDSGQQVSVIVLDNSGSMAGLLIDNAKQAAKLIVDKSIEGRSSIGLVTFSDFAKIEFAVTAVTSDAVRAALKSTIDAIAVSTTAYFTDIQVGAIEGLELLLNVPMATPKVVHLLSDGFSFVDRQSIISQYNALDVPMFTFAFGAGADIVLLAALAEGTGGVAFQTSTSLADIALAFDEANARFLGAITIDQDTTTLSIEVQRFDFPVDESVGRLELTVVFDSAPAGASVFLIDPEGISILPVSVSTNLASKTLLVFVVNDPGIGPWSLTASSRLANIGFAFSATALLRNSPITLSVNSIHGASLQYPAPFVIQANLALGLGIRNANFSGTFRTPTGQILPLVFRDNGLPPDAISGDGSYAAVTNYFLDGEYLVTVTADNENRPTSITYNGTRRSPADGGTGNARALAQLPDVPLREPFLRETLIKVNVSGVVSDDHGDFFQDATVVTVNNASVFGRFDHTRDLDFFAFTVPAGITSISARVTDRGGPSRLRLTVFDINGTTILAPGMNSQAGYLMAVADVFAGLTYFALVEETSGDLTGGRYAFSVGSEIASDNAPPRFAIEDSGGGGGCLIATAAYGTPLASEIGVLRDIRDRYLLRTTPGIAFVDAYYRVSPAIADKVAAHAELGAVIRLLLVPILMLSKLISVAPFWTLALLTVGIFASFALGMRRSAIRSCRT